MIVLTLHRDTPLSRDEIDMLPSGCYPVLSTSDVIARAELDLPPAHAVRFAVEMVRSIPGADLEATERPSAEAGALLHAGALTDPYRTWMPALYRKRLPTAATLTTMAVSPVIVPNIPDAPPEALPAPLPVPEPSLSASPPLLSAPTEPESLPPGIPTRAVSASSLPPELASFMDTLLSTPASSLSGAPAPPLPTPPVPMVPMVPTAAVVPASLPAVLEGPDPWALLKRGQVDDAKDAFKGYNLDEAEREKVRALLTSPKPLEIARGCWISRITRWKSSSSMINRVLYHNDPRVRLEAVRALGIIAGPAAEPALHMLLRDSDPDVRNTAQRVLNRLHRRGR